MASIILLAGIFAVLYALVMDVIQGGNVIQGSGLDAPILNAGAPVAGTDEIQTLTTGGTIVSGTFRIMFDGFRTAPITWSATNNTFRDNVDAALEALPNIGTAGITTAVGSMSSGIGTLTMTFVTANGKRAQSLMTIVDNLLTGTDPTVAITETTPGVTATGHGMAAGAHLIDVTNKMAYINTGTPAAPTWTKIGSQS